MSDFIYVVFDNETFDVYDVFDLEEDLLRNWDEVYGGSPWLSWKAINFKDLVFMCPHLFDI